MQKKLRVLEFPSLHFTLKGLQTVRNRTRENWALQSVWVVAKLSHSTSVNKLQQAISWHYQHLHTAKYHGNKLYSMYTADNKAVKRSFAVINTQ